MRDYDPAKDTTPALSSEHWDCECYGKYIQRNGVEKCPVCGAWRDEMPDSRLYEVGLGIHFAEERTGENGTEKEPD